MHPDSVQDTAIASAGAEGGAFDTWTALQKSTDRPRANIIADITGHPQGAPSVSELEYMNPDLQADAIRRHLAILKDVRVVAELVVPTGERVRGYPYKFYTITDEARALFDANDLFPEEAWRRQYARVKKSSRIAELEAMPRPEERS